jgi:ubiquinone/menaquinone biosynthesis C-methylase UbiE
VRAAAGGTDRLSLAADLVITQIISRSAMEPDRTALNSEGEFMNGNTNVYDHVFAPMYESWVSLLSKGMNDEQFYLEEASGTGGPVLDLGCGTGRIALPLAEAGISVIGLDIAPAMVEVARRRALQQSAEVQERTRFMEGDMRDFDLDQRFKLIIIPYTSFMHLLKPKDQRQSLKCIHRHLSDDGRLIFATKVLPEEALAKAQLPLEGRIEQLVTDTHPENGNRLSLGCGMCYNPETQLVDTLFRLEEIDGSGKTVNVIERSLAQYHFRPKEIQALLKRCGYILETVYGDFERGPVRAAGNQVWVAHKQ